MYVFVAITVAVLFYLICVRPFNHWRRRGVVQYEWWVSLIEMILSFKPYRCLTETVEMVYNDFRGKRYCGIYQMYQPALLIKDTELIKQLTVKDFDHFLDHNQFLAEDSVPMFQNNLFALRGEKWRNMRATLSPSFTSSKMKVIFKLISEHIATAVEYFEEQPQPISLEMKDAFSRITNDVIATTAFGINCDSLRHPNNEFYLAGKEITTFSGLQQNLKLFFVMIMPRLSKWLGFRLFSKHVTEFFSNIVKTNVESREKHGIVRPDMIHLLVEARKGRSDSTQLSDDDIIAQALIFFFAGFDSVSTVLSFLAHELAVNSDIQERLQKEIDETSAHCTEGLTYEALFKMKYMDMVVSEILRKWPPGIITDRVCVKSYVIEPVMDNVSTKVTSCGFRLLRYTETNNSLPILSVFDPERFNDVNKANINPYAYIPFGSGPRSCIANRFALMEIKTLFFYLLSKFTITVVDKTNVNIRVAKSSFQLTAEGGFWLGLKPRNL